MVGRAEGLGSNLFGITEREALFAVRAEDGIFDVIHDVSAPEHIKDNTRRPMLALMALDADQIDAEACVTTVGQNRPREQQNFVFLLVPEIVHVQGEVWSEDRVIHTQEVRNRLEEAARDVLARRKLKAQPENYGITAARLADKDFDARLKERELALETVVTQVYNAVWFPSASGQVTSKEIKAAGGEGGASVLEQLKRLLQDEGELITAEKATTQETLLSLGKLFFESSQTPTLEELHRHFACNRRWPVLEQPALLDMRSLYLAGLVRRVLICAPASLTRQWQREMASKFLLPFGRALGGASPRHAYLLPFEEEHAASSLYKPDLVIVSTGLVARRDRRRELDTAQSFDIALVDEAHYARRKNPTQGAGLRLNMAIFM